MRKIAITGAGGLIGWHTRVWLDSLPDTVVVPVPRPVWGNADVLASALSGCDAVVHLAAMNRGADTAVYETNLGLATTLSTALERSGQAPHVLHASSTQIDRDNAYGGSKKAAADILAGWARTAGAGFTDLILPNVFGEGGRPFHNSVVSTFCHLLAGGGSPEIDVDAEIEFLHAHKVARAIGELIETPAAVWRPDGTRLSVSALLDRLSTMDRDYRRHFIPDLRGDFDLDLFNTYRSYLFPDHYPVALQQHTDQRGSLVEAIREGNGGQIHYSNTHPGYVRGEHFHFRKVERFVVLAGDAEIAVRRVGDDAITRFRVSGDRPAYLDMPTMHTHNLRNIGTGELIAMFWTHDLHDPEAPDTVRMAVEPDAETSPQPASGKKEAVR